MPSTLTPRQREILEYIRRYIEEYGYSPSLTEIARACPGKAKGNAAALSTIHKHLDALKRKGYIAFERSRYLGFYIRLLDGRAEQVIDVPVVGSLNSFGEVFFGERSRAALFPSALKVRDKEAIFGLFALGDIPAFSISEGDCLIFDPNTPPKGSDLMVIRSGESYALVQYYAISDIGPERMADYESMDYLPVTKSKMKMYEGANMLFIPVDENLAIFRDDAASYEYVAVVIRLVRDLQ